MTKQALANEIVNFAFVLGAVSEFKHRPYEERMILAEKSIIAFSEALFMLLLYYRTYVFHIFLGPLFGIDESNVCRYLKRIEPLLAGIFKIPERGIKMSEQEILELIFDATEQE